MMRALLLTGILLHILYGQNRPPDILRVVDSLDRSWSSRLQGTNRHPFLDIGLESWALGTPVIETGSALVFLNRNPSVSRQILIGEALTGVVSYSLKALIARRRPDRTYQPRLWNTRITPSFPSGHVAAFTVYASLMARTYPRLAPEALGLILLTGYSQIYNGNHYLGDVLAGIILGYSLGEFVFYQL